MKFIEHTVNGFINQKERVSVIDEYSPYSRWISLSNKIYEDDTLIALLTRVFMIEIL